MPNPAPSSSNSPEPSSHTRVPILKFTTTRALGSFSVDVSLDGTKGVEGASVSRELLSELEKEGKRERAERLVLLWKTFLRAHGVHEVRDGGLGGLSAFLMVVSYLQLELPRDPSEFPPSSGLDWLNFVHYYGFEFDYRSRFICIDNGGYLGYKTDRPSWINKSHHDRLCIKHPVDHTRDLSSGSYDIDYVKDALKQTYTLLARTFTSLPASPDELDSARQQPSALRQVGIELSPQVLERWAENRSSTVGDALNQLEVSIRLEGEVLDSMRRERERVAAERRERERAAMHPYPSHSSPPHRYYAHSYAPPLTPRPRPPIPLLPFARAPKLPDSATLTGYAGEEYLKNLHRVNEHNREIKAKNDRIRWENRQMEQESERLRAELALAERRLPWEGARPSGMGPVSPSGYAPSPTSWPPSSSSSYATPSTWSAPNSTPPPFSYPNHYPYTSHQLSPPPNYPYHPSPSASYPYSSGSSPSYPDYFAHPPPSLLSSPPTSPSTFPRPSPMLSQQPTTTTASPTELHARPLPPRPSPPPNGKETWTAPSDSGGGEAGWSSWREDSQ